MSRNIHAGTAAIALALLAAACSDSSGPGGGGGGTNSLTAAEAQQLGGDIVLDAAEMFEVSSFDPVTGIPMMMPSPSGGPGHMPPPSCITVSPVPPVNSDGDIVPDSVRFDFSGCVFTHHMGEVTDSLDGTIDIVDPLPLATSNGVRHVFTQFTRARTSTTYPARSFVAILNGTREWGASPDTLGHTVTDFSTQWIHANGVTTSHDKNWAGKFVAATPGTILPGLALPAGSWTVAGSSDWVRDTRSWSVVTSTTTPLAYDPACQVPPRITSGSLHLVVTRDGVVTDVDITFTACGQYSVTRTPAS